MLIGNMVPRLTGNTFARNIVMREAKERDQIAFVVARMSFENDTHGTIFDSNLYFSSAVAGSSDAWPRPTPLGSFAEWRAAGYGADSRVADPGFHSTGDGDFGRASHRHGLRAAPARPRPMLDRC